MRTVVALLLCLPLLVPPGVCACGTAAPARAATKCGCCHKPARKSCPAKPGLAGQPRPDDHAPTCPAHPAADVRLAKHSTPLQLLEVPAQSLAALIPAVVGVSHSHVPVSDSHADPPLYLDALRC